MKFLPLLSAALLSTVFCVSIHAQHDQQAAGYNHSEIDEIASAVLPLPEAYREGATVLGYDENGAVVVIRDGGNGLYCLADKPGDDRFQAVCYHESLEPFMARGRELRAQGLTGKAVLEKRHEEIDEGLLQAPTAGSILYNMMMDLEDFDPETATPALYAIYTPYATEASTGLASQPPAPGGPWIMRAGTASAHIMVVIPNKHDH
ncbi:MAG: hypothetical protein HKN43_09285 [Rhodothermales bacterium]|nr:hypothetical protein [Rhodothermales bacterium]